MSEDVVRPDDSRIAEEAAKGQSQEKQNYIKMVAGARLPLYVLAPPPALVALIKEQPFLHTLAANLYARDWL